MLSWSAPCHHSPQLLPPLLMASLLFIFIFPLFLVLIFLSFPLNQVSLLLHSSFSHLLLTMAEPTLSLSFSLILHDQYFPTGKKKKINWNQLKINGHFKITKWSMLFSDRKRPAYKGQFHKLEFHYHIKPATQITWICICKF